MEYDLTKILPHNPPMILISSLEEINLEEKYVITKAHITSNMIFYNKEIQGVSSLAGIEFMAQTIGCYAYFRNHNKTKIGFLLGTRMYNNATDVFKLDETFTIKAIEIFGNDGIISFECFIYNNSGEECASATLNVYQDDNAKGLIENAK